MITESHVIQKMTILVKWPRSVDNLSNKKTGAELTHTGQFSIDPAVLPGNIENFIGIVQMPVGVAGPVLVNGEHAKGEFYVPLATH